MSRYKTVTSIKQKLFGNFYAIVISDMKYLLHFLLNISLHMFRMIYLPDLPGNK